MLPLLFMYPGTFTAHQPRSCITAAKALFMLPGFVHGSWGAPLPPPAAASLARSIRLMLQPCRHEVGGAPLAAEDKEEEAQDPA